MDLPERVGRYEVEGLLGEGGMGRVLLARDTSLGRKVALKVLRTDLGIPADLRAQLVERMRQEARAAATLSHPGIVTLHDTGEDPDAGIYLVFELIDGPTLRERLQEAGPLTPSEVVGMARTLGAALTHAHAAGVVHRDVKPENIMLARSGVKLTDLGIARLPDSTLTGSMTVLGTPAYSAPEALATGTFSPASDQFSLAATLYEALTGRRAFPGDDALTVATRVAAGRPAAPSTQHPALRAFGNLDAILARALATRPGDRFPSCEAFGEVLASELAGQNVDAPTPWPATTRGARASRRWQNGAALLGACVIAGLIIAGRLRASREGVSLRGVARAFGSTVSSARANAPPPPHRARGGGPASAPSGAATAAPTNSADASAAPSASAPDGAAVGPVDAGIWTDAWLEAAP